MFNCRVDLRGILKCLALTWSLVLFYRFLFIIFNLSYLEALTFSEIGLAYLYGLRFDLATVLIINLIFILASLVPLPHKLYQKILKLIFVISNAGFLVFNIADLEFFSFIDRKMTWDIFDMGSDVQNQMGQLILNYWYLTALWGGMVLGLWRFYPRRQVNQFNGLQWLGVTFLILVLTAIGIRGGLQLRSISPKSAFIFERHEAGNIALNSAYTMARSFGKKQIPMVSYFKTDQVAMDFIKQKLGGSSSQKKLHQPNVVIIIVESLSQEYIETGYTPLMEKRFEKGVFFKEAYANGRRSIEALPSILLGLPSILQKPIYQSQFQSNKFIGLPQVLKNRGYHTSFFHGGKTGTMDFNAFVKAIGVDLYVGKEDYPKQEHDDGHWGIYDHHFLSFFHSSLNRLTPPFFSTLFTLSSHQPYSLPTQFQNKFPKGQLPIHESIGYVDFALDNFFKQIEKESWYANTLFILTGDHTQKLATKAYQTAWGRYRVPIWFYHPQFEFPTYEPQKLTQHADIYPSVLDLIGSDGPHLLFGSSVFSEHSGIALNYTSGHYLLKHGRTRVWQQGDQFRSDPPDRSSEQLLKALIQYGINGLKKNSLFP